MICPRPFVKYVGGKGQLIEELLKHVPKTFKDYHEPMVGGGALYWALVRGGHLVGKSVALADTNEALIQTYQEIRNDPERLIRTLQLYADQYVRQGGDLFYAIRDAWNAGVTNPARFIFLKQTAFNGLWRCNRKGEINMPWGQYEKPKILDAENIRACAQALQGQGVWKAEFEASSQMVKKGDLVYFDPPYWGCFDAYSPEGFSQGQHLDLIRHCALLSASGVYVIYSNEDVREVRGALKKFWKSGKVHSVQSRRFINCDGEGREPVLDLIVTS